MLAAFRDALQEELGDAVAIEYFDGGTLGDEIVHMEMVRSGQLDVIPIGSDAVQLDAKWAVFDMPFLIPTREVIHIGPQSPPCVAHPPNARDTTAAIVLARENSNPHPASCHPPAEGRGRARRCSS
jgi:hypothetical protein